MSTSQVSAPALVLVHGFALDARMWRRQVEAFEGRYRVLTLDLPGFGPQARDLGEVEPAAEIGRALDASGLVGAHVVANSYGAAAAVDFALQNPRRVHSLTLMGPLMLGRRTGFETWSRCVALANEGDRATACELWLEDPLFEGVRQDEDLYEEVRQIVLDYGGGHWTGRVTSQWTHGDPIPHLATLDVPSMVVSGEADIPSFVLMAEAYGKALPHVRREIIQGSGHFPNLEQPDLFNHVVRYFIENL
jgi:3-oxoadipate enol-lactonase